MRAACRYRRQPWRDIPVQFDAAISGDRHVPGLQVERDLHRPRASSTAWSSCTIATHSNQASGVWRATSRPRSTPIEKAGSAGVCRAAEGAGVCRRAEGAGVCRRAEGAGVCRGAGGAGVCRAAGAPASAAQPRAPASAAEPEAPASAAEPMRRHLPRSRRRRGLLGRWTCRRLPRKSRDPGFRTLVADAGGRCRCGGARRCRRRQLRGRDLLRADVPGVRAGIDVFRCRAWSSTTPLDRIRNLLESRSQRGDVAGRPRRLSLPKCQPIADARPRPLDEPWRAFDERVCSRARSTRQGLTQR